MSRLQKGYPSPLSPQETKITSVSKKYPTKKIQNKTEKRQIIDFDSSLFTCTDKAEE